MLCTIFITIVIEIYGLIVKENFDYLRKTREGVVGKFGRRPVWKFLRVRLRVFRIEFRSEQRVEEVACRWI